MPLLTDLDRQEIESAHLGLDWTSIDFSKLRDPFSGYYSTDSYNEILKAIRDPRNFFWTCKYILNIEPTVFQLVWLDQLWNYSYPLLIASRGASKSFTLGLYYALRATITQGCKIVIAAPTFRQSKYVFEYIENIWENAPIWRNLCGDNSGPSHRPEMFEFQIGKSSIVAIPLGNGDKIRGLRANYVDVEEFNCGRNMLLETDLGLIRIEDTSNRKDVSILNKDGKYELPIRYIKTPIPVDVYKVITERGYSIECSEKHKVLTTKGFKLAKDLTNNDCIISDNKYKFPNRLVSNDSLVMDENLAWMFGILTSEGYICRKEKFGILMTDMDCVDRFGCSIKNIKPDQYFTMKTINPKYDNRFKKECKRSYYITVHNTELRNQLEKLGLDRLKAIDKKIPWSILQSPRHIVIKYLSGLFEGDGSAFLWKQAKQNNRLGVAYYTVSQQLARELQVILKKLGYLSNIASRKSHLSKNLGYIVRLNGLYSYKFAKELNIQKWRNILDECYEKNIKDKSPIWYNKKLNNYTTYCRVNGKTKTIGVRKSYEEALKLYDENYTEHLKVKSVTKLPEQDVLYDIEVPDTHTFYGNGMIQHNSVNEEVFEVVLQGFIATSSNPVENIKTKAKIKKLKEKGLLTKKMEEEIAGNYKANQVILSGTTGWDFQPFAKRWKKYRKIIKSGGDPEKLKEAFGGEVDPNISHKDFCIIRIPVDLLPDGMMDAKAIAQAKANNDPARYNLEYGAVFSKDSNGFFPGSLIESCVTKEPIMVGNSQVQFAPRMSGDPYGKYIMGIDPASESDNFAIIVVEHFPTHNRVIYCWTIKRKEAFKQFKDKNSQENNFYAFVARKIRSLMNSFRIEYISLDSQGGGLQVMEALHDIKRLEHGELPLWPLKKEDAMTYPGSKDYGYDEEQGPHIIEMVSMSNAQYVTEANHGLRKDMMNKMLLFPYADALTLEMAGQIDLREEDKIDTLENNILEIEKLKEELSTIVHTTTLNGRDRFDTPSVILPGGKKGSLRKDRYSALLYANGLARRLFRESTIDYSSQGVGGFADQYKGQDINGPLYVGNHDDFIKWANQSVLGVGVNQQQSSDPFSYYGQAFHSTR